MLFIAYCFDQVLVVGTVEGVALIAKVINDAPEAPDINSRVIFGIFHHFWSLITECSNVLNYQSTTTVLGCDAKISYLELVVFAFQEQVLWLEISMYYVLLMEILKAHQRFNNEFFYSRLCKFSFCISDIDLKITTVTEIKKNAQCLLNFINDEVAFVFVYVRVAEFAHCFTFD